MAARFGLLFSLALLLAAEASAQTVTTLLDDNFDSYATQEDFQAVWPRVPPAVNPPIPPEDTWPASNFLLQSFDTPAVTPVSAPNMIGHATTTTRNQRAFTESGNISTTTKVSFSFDFFDSDAAASPYRQFNNLQDGFGPPVGVGLGTNQLVSMGLNNNQAPAASGGNFYMARILGVNPVANVADPDGGPMETVGGTGTYFKLNDFVDSPLRSTGWHNLRVEISTDDGLSTDYDFYVDNILAERVHNVGTAATLRSYELVRIGSGITSTQVAFTDNVKVTLTTITAPPADDADFDGDGDVDGADFLTWQRGLGISDGSANLADGDANDDGNVTAADLAIWKGQFATAVPAVGAVPEPATVALAAVAMFAGLAATRRR